MKNRFQFKLAKQEQRALIHQWLEQDHIKEWIHGDGLKGTLVDLEKSFTGDASFQHWIAYENDTPFAYLLTSKVVKQANGEVDPYAKHCQKGGEAITLDMFICDLNYLGKGLSTQLIHEFLISQFPHVYDVFIDPEVRNARAIHVYEKAGFKVIDEFIASWLPVPHYMMRLDWKNLREKTSNKA